MKPLPDAERKRFIERALALGVPPERIKQDLAQLEGLAPLSVTTQPSQDIVAGRLPGGGPPVTPEEQAAGREFFTSTVPRAAAITAGGLATGPGIIPSALGSMGADILFQSVREALGGRKIDPTEITATGVGTVGGGLAGKAIVRSTGAVGGIPSEFLERVGQSLNPFKRGEGFRLTIGRPAQTAELELGRRIQSAVESVGKTITAGRKAKDALIKHATQGGKRVSIQPIVDKLREFIIPGATEKSAVIFNRKVAEFARKLSLRKTVTPTQLDTLMTKELAPAAFTGTGKPSLNRFSAAIRAARNTAKETLESALGPEARAASQSAFEELTMREHAERVFGPTRLSLENKLRNLFKPGHEAEQELLDNIGKQAGIPLLDEAKRLATKRVFTKDDRVSASVLNRVFLLTGTPQIARAIAKTTAPLQRHIGPATAGTIGLIQSEETD